MSQAHTSSQTLYHWHMGVTTQVEVVFMEMTDSHPTWSQSPPLELDCTTRPDRRGELLCLPSPDRPIRAAKNWEVLGPTAGWEGLGRKWLGLRKKNPHPNTNNRIYPQTWKPFIQHTPQDVHAQSSEPCKQLIWRDTQFKVWQDFPL